jgi:hypothetical protein
VQWYAAQLTVTPPGHFAVPVAASAGVASNNIWDVATIKLKHRESAKVSHARFIIFPPLKVRLLRVGSLAG